MKKKKRTLIGTIFRVLLKTAGILAAVYAALFAVFYFDLDGKLLYYGVTPFLRRHYDNMEREDKTVTPYMQTDPVG